MDMLNFEWEICGFSSVSGRVPLTLWLLAVKRVPSTGWCYYACFVLFYSSDKETQCEIMDRLIQLIVRDDFDQEDARALATCVCQILSAYFENSLLPQELDDE